MSENIGFKFVEPCEYDLGHVFSDGSASEPILFITSDLNDAEQQIQRFAKVKGRPVKVISVGESAKVILSDLIISDIFNHVVIFRSL